MSEREPRVYTINTPDTGVILVIAHLREVPRHRLLTDVSAHQWQWLCKLLDEAEIIRWAADHDCPPGWALRG